MDYGVHFIPRNDSMDGIVGKSLSGLHGLVTVNSRFATLVHNAVAPMGSQVEMQNKRAL